MYLVLRINLSQSITYILEKLITYYFNSFLNLFLKIFLNNFFPSDMRLRSDVSFTSRTMLRRHHDVATSTSMRRPSRYRT